MNTSHDPRRSTSDEAAPQKRPRWSISLGGLLIFAAGMMVGFAPMRAWLFFRDEPKHVLIEAAIFDLDAAEQESVRREFDRVASAGAAPDPFGILRHRAGSRLLSEPSIVTAIDRAAHLQVGGERFVAFPHGAGVKQPRFFGIDATFVAKLRPSGSFELDYRISHSAFEDDAAGNPIVFNDAVAKSTVIVEPGIWHRVELHSPSAEDVRDGRIRWLFLRAQPYEP